MSCVARTLKNFKLLITSRD